MKCRVENRDSHMTPQKFQEAMDGIAAYRQLKQEKAKLRTILNSLSDEQIRADLSEFQKSHTMDGERVSEDSYQLLQAELIRRGPYRMLLNPNNRFNKML